MTRWQEFPLRPQGRNWAGINTRSGKLDDGSGQMKDSSLNCIINRGDELAKRKGMIRGIDERFTGSVCGLHKYMDECGREWLIVADEESLSIRQPFSIPSFSSSDAYPSDSFQSDGAPNSSHWLNIVDYEQLDGSLLLRAGVLNGGNMRWFKDATNFSYKVFGDWTQATDSTLVFAIKAGSIARIEARIVNVADVITAFLIWTDSTGTERQLGSEVLPVDTTTGIITLSYGRDIAKSVFNLELVVQPTGGVALTIQDFLTLTALDDADFGQGTSLRIESTTGVDAASIESIQGDPL